MAAEQKVVLDATEFTDALSRTGEKVSIPKAWLTDDRLAGAFVPLEGAAKKPATATRTAAKKADESDVI